MRRRTKATLGIIALAVFSTVITVIFVLNYGNYSPQVSKPLAVDYSVQAPHFPRTLESLLGAHFTHGNSIKPLRNGDEFYPAMLDAIRQAESTINFETFVYWTGDIAREFAYALAEQSEKGVQVRVLLDAVGASRMDDDLVKMMEDAGVMVEYFRAVTWFNLDRLNNRTHRKFLIVDGKVGFTGGAGIGEEWAGNAQDKNHWRDTHFELRGPVVAQMQGGFAQNWMTVRHEVIHGVDFFPKLQPQGDIVAQAFNSSADSQANSVRTAFLLAIAAAKESIHIGSPYFVPDEFLLRALVKARQRGVKIEVITQGENGDSWLAKAASAAMWGDLLKAGAKFYQFDPTLYHTKVMIVDEEWVSIGSANFDNRSFMLNEENNVNVLDKEFAANMLAQFQEDKKRSNEVSYQDWLDRPWYSKVLETFSLVLRSQV